MGDVIRFPALKNLTVEELEQFEYYKEKMNAARTIAEMNHYYYLAKGVIEKSNQKNN
ncbi:MULTISPECIES: hypothetical protein [Bacillus cereus group]|uniref:hypothetical protein n=1 Tax=Bacillus cereus group TaxID=86661 RepID=UPI001E4DC6B2|nr:MULTISPECIES: hypothetical protein [Bacillus cereus group]MCC2414293.1 hypothetical protein [Bacillus paranthracis]MDX5923209.1 hypothetical protein [Bacillus cereus group sp. BfR-BA-01033]MDX5975785.1 hypothetical protein [Bacillus cereus group sp. BfR-BA-00287]